MTDRRVAGRRGRARQSRRLVLRQTRAAGSGEAKAGSSPSNPNSAAVSVLKSGVVNGMPYTLYSDESIEAQFA